jgi:hypothetical protein
LSCVNVNDTHMDAMCVFFPRQSPMSSGGSA